VIQFASKVCGGRLVGNGTGSPGVAIAASRFARVPSAPLSSSPWVRCSETVDVLTISRRLGHSSASITLDVYGHLIEGADADAANAIEGMLIK
jgi:hypothetical protein